MDKHKFWCNQPVQDYNSEIDNEGPIENKTLDLIRKEPYDIPNNFYWYTIDIMNDNDLNEVYNLLYKNYFMNKNSEIRFNYSKSFLRWALTPPGYFKDWHVGIKMKSEKKDKLVGFISGIPVNIKLKELSQKLCEINFLCCWEKLRNKSIAPLMIKEVTRRVNCCDIYQAIYTAGVVIPKPISICNYHHRPINIEKLVDVGFFFKKETTPMKIMKKLYDLSSNDNKSIKLRPIEEKDVNSSLLLLNNYFEKLSLHPVFTEDEFKHWFLSKNNNMYTYVISKNDKVTDFCSFFSIPFNVINNSKYNNLNVAYSFYNVATSINILELMNMLLYVIKNNNFDVFNCLDIMDNNEFLNKLKFKKGSGVLNYYLFNYKLKYIESCKNGIVLF
tara:strand:- start:1582 stop:2742 length:1161 start_codon:yes stop_codon:yes gene_type:complete